MRKIFLAALLVFLVMAFITEKDEADSYYQFPPKELPVPDHN